MTDSEILLAAVDRRLSGKPGRRASDRFDMLPFALYGLLNLIVGLTLGFFLRHA